MKAIHSDIFKDLVDAHFKGSLDDKVAELLIEHKGDKEKLAHTIANLCGVDVPYDENYLFNLKQAIKNYTNQQGVVSKIADCPADCADPTGRTECQKSCPFDAIIYDETKGGTFIDVDTCTDCGFCVEACPSGSLLDKTEFIPLVDLFKSGKPVIAAVAPAIAGQYGENVSLDMLRTAFKKVGFTDMVEVAFFADMLTLKEAIEFDHLVQDKGDLMITSCCCPMWVGMVKHVYNNLVKHVSPSVSPMIAAGRVLKELNKDALVVFIGPCIAKKGEIKQPDLLGDIDYVLTFAEMQLIFEALNIDPKNCEPTQTMEYASREGRLYARTGGVSLSVHEAIQRIFPEKADFFKSVQANGVVECKNILDKVQTGEITGNFLEGMGCVGGCVGGPKAIIPRDKGREKADEFAENAEVKISLDSDRMKDILSRLGINSAEDFKDHEKVAIFERKF